ncbi:MAG: substrate-binding domain-containing protein, partial [Aliifodinibius sp.]|nr:substrate-binding domain-containing protein [candidate division Zixibacteria bacterium]NIT59281.1 substrate-binding domain-containing protein [Fodinibius sp.]NIW46802.1 substrate-binding domain-containing protein [Gammaproteobacteria bacterium]NIR65710.1 substrate-binding domain-containing protein [candidate division Zixibacteria bacterium]NIS47394.1 substrate-binding domain-containing protein [candidate division Zixibacteria bacterium]
RGIRVPEDVSIIGFDDESSAAYMVPPLTTVRQPAIHMGQEAAKAILALINNQSLDHQPFQAEMVIRESVARQR